MTKLLLPFILEAYNSLLYMLKILKYSIEPLIHEH